MKPKMVAAIWPGTVSDQKRAAAAGSIISPTAISVPSAWKPPTRFSTTKARKTVTGMPRPPTARRKPGSRHSSTSGRQMTARRQQVSVAMPADQQQRRVVQRQDGAEQHMQQIDIGAAQRHQQHAEAPARSDRSAAKLASSRRTVSRDTQPGQQRHGEAGDEPAQGHRQAATGRPRGSRPQRRAGWRAPSHRRSGSSGAASGTRRAGGAQRQRERSRPAPGA